MPEMPVSRIVVQFEKKRLTHQPQIPGVTILPAPHGLPMMPGAPRTAGPARTGPARTGPAKYLKK